MHRALWEDWCPGKTEDGREIEANSLSPVLGQAATGEQWATYHTDSLGEVGKDWSLLSLAHLNAQQSLTSRLEGLLGIFWPGLLTSQMEN